MKKYQIDWVQGSSPLTRGKRKRYPGAESRSRLIPAHAGKTTLSNLTSSLTRAHPRSRGENSPPRERLNSLSGLSPLTRGKLYLLRMVLSSLGLIPAHAGKTRADGRRHAGNRAHPRSRGENVSTEGMRSTASGSSPLTRGKPGVCSSRATSSGLIPAHAGKTHTSQSSSRASRAHPRSRGENWIYASEKSAGAGSSPLTRGKRTKPGIRGQSIGLIPAHAGKTERRRHGDYLPAAHPRSRGENSLPSVCAPGIGGSSPLTRGKPVVWDGVGRLERLIPAHAGKTADALRQAGHHRAHPRSRGENDAALAELTREAGSSPLTRGKRSAMRRGRSGRGLIPAHAGKTLVVRLCFFLRAAHPRSRGEN